MAAGDPPSIPTWYNGVLYRSRTEARYAVMFDQLQIKFEYETQGFEVKGIKYLPDFLAFPALGMLWVEIKGSWEQDPRGIARWRNFSPWRPQPSRGALIIGIPALDNRADVIGGDEDVSPSDAWYDDTQVWRPCPGGHHFDLAQPGLFGGKFAEDGCPYSDPDGHGQDWLERAIDAARNERFDGRPPSSGTAA